MSRAVATALLKFVYSLSSMQHAEIALGLSCVQVSHDTGVARLIDNEGFVQDETRFEYFGRADVEFEQDIPSNFMELIAYAQENDPLIVLSATILNAVDQYVLEHFPAVCQD